MSSLVLTLELIGDGLYRVGVGALDCRLLYQVWDFYLFFYGLEIWGFKIFMWDGRYVRVKKAPKFLLEKRMDFCGLHSWAGT